MRSLFFIIILSAISCAKDNSFVVSDNVAPPDYTIDRVIKENYVNKLYISLLGREPNSDEFNTAIQTLGDDANIVNREELVEIVQSKDEYFDNLFDIFRQDYLNGVDTLQIREDYIFSLQFLIENAENTYLLEEYQLALDRFLLLIFSSEDLKSAQANTVDIHRRCVDNQLYDDINMGSFNYVVSMYQNFLSRYPTQSELENGILMVDGEQAVCFGQNGNSKNDFNILFFEHDGYYEGQVIHLFNNILYRNPSSIEASSLAYTFKKEKDFKELQKKLLITDEFLGIE